MNLTSREKFIALTDNDSIQKSDAIILLEGDGFNRYKKAVDLYNVLWTFILVCITFVFFRSSSLSDAFMIFNKIVFFESGSTKDVLQYIPRFAIFSIVIMEALQYFQETRGSIREYLSKQLFVVRWAAYILAILTLLIYGAFHSNSEFIYFQF